SHRRRRIAALVVVLGALAAGWFFLAPTGIGGDTTYVVTDGISMHPRIHTGDLALVRPASSYHVGDIVAYRNPQLHVVVLHRIHSISPSGRYRFKGDNNSWIDPGSVPASAATCARSTRRRSWAPWPRSRCCCSSAGPARRCAAGAVAAARSRNGRRRSGSGRAHRRLPGPLLPTMPRPLLGPLRPPRRRPRRSCRRPPASAARRPARRTAASP